MKKLMLIFLVLCAGCELIVDIDVPREPVKIVMNGIARTDSVWNVELSDSKYILDYPGSFTPIVSGSVVVEKADGSKINLLQTLDGLYRSDQRPEPGHTYTVTASAPNRQAVRSVISVPLANPMTEVKWDSTNIIPKNNSFGGPQQYQVPLSITFNDPPAEENFYSVTVFLYRDFTRVDFNGVEHHVHDKTETIIDIQDDRLEDNSNYIFRFRDKTFNGQTYTLPVLVTFFDQDNNGYYRAEVVLTTINKDLFLFFDQQFLQNSIDGDPFAQPVQVNSNVENGFGLMGAMDGDRRFFEIKAQE